MSTQELSAEMLSEKRDSDRVSAAQVASAAPSEGVVMDCRIKTLHYGHFLAVRDTDIPIVAHEITAFIGPSGCGKSTVLRSLNRMNDFVNGFRFEGSVHYRGQDIYAQGIDPVAVRRSIGMVFQQPNPFAMSIIKNVAFGLQLNGVKGDHAERVENALRGAALWDEVKDKLTASGLGLSGGQQQRLCVARGIAVEPEVLLLDEPASALDPVSTAKLEETLMELRHDFSIVIVTHNLQQAARISDRTGFMFLGRMIEFRPTADVFERPQSTRTRDYVTGRFG